MPLEVQKPTREAIEAALIELAEAEEECARALPAVQLCERYEDHHPAARDAWESAVVGRYAARDHLADLGRVLIAIRDAGSDAKAAE